MPRSINREKFSAAVEELRKEPAQTRLVDVLLPLREKFVELRKEHRTFLDLWRAVVKAEVECTYPNFVRAMKQVLEQKVTPLEEARARSRARRAAKSSLPAVPVSLRPHAAAPAVAPAGTAAPSNEPMFPDPYQAQATRQVASVLVETFGKKNTPAKK